MANNNLYKIIEGIIQNQNLIVQNLSTRVDFSGDYTDLLNMPKLGGITLSGDIPLSSFGFASNSDVYSKDQADQRFLTSAYLGEMAGAFHFKGTKQAVSALDDERAAKAGDVWQIDGRQYAYNGQLWVQLGLNLDSIIGQNGILTGYYKKTQVYNTTEINTILTGYYTKSEIDTITSSKLDQISGTNGILTSYYNKTEINNITSSKLDQISGTNGILTSYYNKTEIDNITSSKLDQISGTNGILTGYYTKTQVYNTNEIDTITSSKLDQISGTNGILTGYYTKTESDTTFATKNQLASYITTLTLTKPLCESPLHLKVLSGDCLSSAATIVDTLDSPSTRSKVAVYVNEGSNASWKTMPSGGLQMVYDNTPVAVDLSQIKKPSFIYYRWQIDNDTAVSDWYSCIFPTTTEAQTLTPDIVIIQDQQAEYYLNVLSGLNTRLSALNV